MNNLEAEPVLDLKKSQCVLTSGCFDSYDNTMRLLDLNPDFQKKYKFYRERYKKSQSGRYKLVKWTKYSFLRHIEFLKMFIVGNDMEKSERVLELACGTGIGIYIMKNLFGYTNIFGINEADQGPDQEVLDANQELLTETGMPGTDFWQDVRIALGVDDVVEIESLSCDSLIQSYNPNEKFNLVYAIEFPVIATTEDDADGLITVLLNSVAVTGKLILNFDEVAYPNATAIINEMVKRGGVLNEELRTVSLLKV